MLGATESHEGAGAVGVPPPEGSRDHAAAIPASPPPGVLEAFPPGTERRRISREHLVNLLNRVNFHDGEVLLAFRDGTSGERLLLPARPRPCAGTEVECRWARDSHPPRDLASLAFEGLRIGDGLRSFQVPATIREAGPAGVRLALPEASLDVSRRRTRRHPCPGIAVEIRQEGCELAGTLESFSACSFAVRLPPLLGAHLDPRAPATVMLRRGGEVVFVEECRLIREAEGDGEGTTVFSPSSVSLRCFPARRVRSDRHRPFPLPTIAFRHPCTGRTVSLKACDISGAGFAVEEIGRHAVLLPGLEIPDVGIEFVAGAVLPCRAKVVYANPQEDGSVRCGLAILEMRPEDHVRLCSFVLQCREAHASVCSTSIDLDALWDFFFETGFIYPAKYAYLQERKAAFQRLYARLYHDTPSISRHVVYQDKGIIHAHIAMFRFHRATWFMHHHAALTSTKHRAGLVVMEQLMRYLKEFHHLPAARMRYIAAYYQPKSRFANRVFGGTVRALNDRGKGSLDTFAYLRHRAAPARPLPPGWELRAAEPSDLEALAELYRGRSGGLMLEGLDLTPEGAAADPQLDREFAELGFTRRRRLHALRAGGVPVALLAANVSDLGLNLSDLTNGIQCFVLRPEGLDAATLRSALDRLAVRDAPSLVSVLLYPQEFADRAGIACEKHYELNVLDMEHFGACLEMLARYEKGSAGAPDAQPAGFRNRPRP